MPLHTALKLSAPEQWTWVPGQCGHCGNSTNLALVGGCAYVDYVEPELSPESLYSQTIAVCASCHGINVIIDSGDHQYPSPRPGRRIDGLPEDVQHAWEEARVALAADAPVAAEHMCRKLLIHVAAEAAKKKCSNFAEAVSALVDAGVITEGMKPWVDLIRLNGNEAAHELQKGNPQRAKLTLEFTQQLLQIVYEMKHRLALAAPKPPSP